MFRSHNVLSLVMSEPTPLNSIEIVENDVATTYI